MIHLSGARKVWQQPIISGADGNVIGSNTDFFQHGSHVIRQPLTITEAAFADRCGWHGFLAPNAKENGNVSGRFLKLMIENFYFFPFGCQIISQLVQLLA